MDHASANNFIISWKNSTYAKPQSTSIGKTFPFLFVILCYLSRDEKRLTTAPIRERPKYSDVYKTNNLELPMIRGKNPFAREVVAVTREAKRSQAGKREEVVRWDN